MIVIVTHIIHPSCFRIAVSNLRQFKLALVRTLPGQVFIMCAISLLISCPRWIRNLLLVVRVLLHCCFGIIRFGLSSEDAFNRVTHAQLLLVVALNIVGLICGLVCLADLVTI